MCYMSNTDIKEKIINFKMALAYSITVVGIGYGLSKVYYNPNYFIYGVIAGVILFIILAVVIVFRS